MGYRNVLNSIHESYEYIPIRSSYILLLHRDLYQYSQKDIGGRFKNTQNVIAENHPDGSQTVRFTSLAPYETPGAIDSICDNFNQAIDACIVDPLVLIPIFINDFLCIHPFNDGNGRIFVLEIFSESKYIDLYRNKLKKIEIKEKDTSEIFLQQIPTAFNEDYIAKKMKKASWEIIKEKCKNAEYSILFLLGSVKENLSDLLIKMGVIEPKKSEDEREILFFYDLKSKEVYGCILEEKQLQEILADGENRSVLLTSYKNYDYERDCIPRYSRINRFTYIYCDRTYNNAITYLNKWADREVYYRYMVYESMPVLLVKNSNSSIFILPMADRQITI